MVKESIFELFALDFDDMKTSKIKKISIVLHTIFIYSNS